ncbi:hypothetical protein MMC25_005276 [Agyrium rufum]|nr:hypothetical protein [Agyrium rufum]
MTSSNPLDQSAPAAAATAAQGTTLPHIDPVHRDSFRAHLEEFLNYHKDENLKLRDTAADVYRSAHADELVYQDVLDTNTALSSEDRQALEAAMQNAVSDKHDADRARMLLTLSITQITSILRTVQDENGGGYFVKGVDANTPLAWKKLCILHSRPLHIPFSFDDITVQLFENPACYLRVGSPRRFVYEDLLNSDVY